MLERIAIHSLMFPVQSHDKAYSALLLLLLPFFRVCPPCSLNSIEGLCSVLREFALAPEFLSGLSWDRDTLRL